MYEICARSIVVVPTFLIHLTRLTLRAVIRTVALERQKAISSAASRRDRTLRLLFFFFVFSPTWVNSRQNFTPSFNSLSTATIS